LLRLKDDSISAIALVPRVSQGVPSGFRKTLWQTLLVHPERKKNPHLYQVVCCFVISFVPFLLLSSSFFFFLLFSSFFFFFFQKFARNKITNKSTQTLSLLFSLLFSSFSFLFFSVSHSSVSISLTKKTRQ
jgi:4-amino-4-deoxy-L-arabinose transferase-like glycosyltransferase